LLQARLLQESPRFPQDSVSQDYYKNQGDSRKIQSSGTNQERIMKPERIGNGTPPMENDPPPVENERHPTDGKCHPTDGNIELTHRWKYKVEKELTPPMENVRTES
jgi:hypothetical protein